MCQIGCWLLLNKGFVSEIWESLKHWILSTLGKGLRLIHAMPLLYIFVVCGHRHVRPCSAIVTNIQLFRYYQWALFVEARVISARCMHVRLVCPFHWCGLAQELEKTLLLFSSLCIMLTFSAFKAPKLFVRFLFLILVVERCRYLRKAKQNKTESVTNATEKAKLVDVCRWILYFDGISCVRRFFQTVVTNEEAKVVIWRFPKVALLQV